MALHDELLVQARRLAIRKKANQADFRRAISGAYSALFHLLVDEASRNVSAHGPAALSFRVARTMEHKDMKTVCQIFAKDAPTAPKLAKLLPRVPQEIRVVAKTFVNLQDKRHEADYDVEIPVLSSDVLVQVKNAELAFKAWSGIKTTPEARIFLTALLFPKNFNR